MQNFYFRDYEDVQIDMKFKTSNIPFTKKMEVTHTHDLHDSVIWYRESEGINAKFLLPRLRGCAN